MSITTTDSTIRQVTIPDNRRPEICAACTSRCCEGMPGALWPMDLAADRSELPDAIAAKLATGRYALDWWEGDIDPAGDLGQVYYLRPATKGKEGRVEDPSWGGACTFLGPTGCALAFDERPTGCKALVPNPNANQDKQCGETTIDGVNYTSKPAAIWEWRKYQAEVQAALAIVQGGAA